MTEKEERKFVDLIKSAYFDLLAAQRICGKGTDPLVEGAVYMMRKLFQEAVRSFWDVPERLDSLIQQLKKRP